MSSINLNVMKKFKNIVIGLAVSALLFASSALAVSTTDYNISEGDLIMGEGTFDIFIINDFGYK